MRVLVADDDPVYRELLQELLGQDGFEVELAADGAEALVVLRQQEPPEIAILDWKMPNMDGCEACRRIRNEKEKEGTSRYIILMTGNRNRQELLRILVAGADDYLLKPFEPLDLKIRLRSAVRITRLEHQLRSLERQGMKGQNCGIQA